MANSKTKVVTGLVRLSYANVWEPKAANENAQPKYSVSIIIPKSDKATLKKINDAIDAAIEEGIGSLAARNPTKPQSSSLSVTAMWSARTMKPMPIRTSSTPIA